MITYLPTKILISDIDEKSLKSIHYSLSVWDKVRFKYKFTAYFYDEENQEVILPGGYNRLKLEEILYDHNHIDRTSINYSHRRRNKVIKLKYDPRDDLQERAIEFLKKDYSQKFLCLNTGDGKTYCTIAYLTKKRTIPMIFIDLDILCQQWKNSILKFTDVKEDEIYIISGNKSIDSLMNMSSDKLAKYKFFICFYKTINTIINDNKLEGFFKYLDIGTKVYDEAHTNYEAIFKIDCITNCESVYLTATPHRSDPIEDKVFQNMFHSVKKFFSNSNSEKYHNVNVINIDSKPSEADRLACTNKYGFNLIAYSNYILEKKYDYFYDKVINTILLGVILKNGKKNRKTAILFSLKSLMNKFAYDLVENLNNKGLDYKIGLLSEDTKKDDKEEVLSSDIIITTDKSFGKGIDVSNLECVICVVPTSSEVKATQMLGRLREVPDREVYYFDIVDNGFQKIKNQTYKKMKVYREKAKSLHTFNL